MQCQPDVELAHHFVWVAGRAESWWERVIELIRLYLIVSCHARWGQTQMQLHIILLDVRRF